MTMPYTWPIWHAWRPVTWRVLGEAEKYGDVQKPHSLPSRAAAILISVFRSSLSTKEGDLLKLHQHGKELGSWTLTSFAPALLSSMNIKPYAIHVLRHRCGKVCCVNCLPAVTSHTHIYIYNYIYIYAYTYIPIYLYIYTDVYSKNEKRKEWINEWMNE